MSTLQTVYIDPQLLINEKKKAAIRNKRMELTGLTVSYCKDCEQTKDIGCFDVTPSRSDKTKGKPRLVCIECANKKRTQPKNKRNRNWYNDPRIKQWGAESSKRASELLTDAYIRRMYNKLGYKAKDVTPEMIIVKRVEIIKKRANAAKNTSVIKCKDGSYAQEERDKMTDGYIRGLIKAAPTYQGKEITDELIKEYRDRLILKRAIRNQKVRKIQEKTTPYVFYVDKELRN
jgi:hypothetical protein